MNKLHVIFQPHRYSRTKDCFVDFLNCFEGADTLTVTEIYSAGESPIEGISGKALCDAIQHEDKHFVETPEAVLPEILKDLKENDFILCLGAGTIGSLPEKLTEAIKALSLKKAV